ncbi:RING finger protein 151-like isoform X7 [Notamacropus eugenii]|uniref:RING finger protein 151-like isoform X7 n=1 Tax=Notamacropus eugenii TaxID=9315 RepID=UPI003B68334D
MGYDIERFVGYVNEGLLCCICQGVLEDPLQAPCEHAFCTSCIHGWLEYHRNCPEDRQALSKSMLRPLYRYMRNDLNRLQLHCRNGERGCKMICSLESVEQHERECAYGWISCTNTGGSLNKSAGPGVRKTCVHIPLQTHSDYVTLGCPVPSEQLHLSGHLSACEHLSGECPKGYVCTVLILLHNGITELRSELKLLRYTAIQPEIDFTVTHFSVYGRFDLKQQSFGLSFKHFIFLNQIPIASKYFVPM